MRPFEFVTEALARHGSKRSSGAGTHWQCPAHDDQTPSLGVSESDDGNALVKCHAGCPTEEVLRKLGLSMSDLFPRARTTNERRKQKWSGSPPKRWNIPDKHIQCRYEYPDSNVEVVRLTAEYRSHSKSTPKTLPRHRDERGEWYFGLGGRKAANVRLYREELAIRALLAGKDVYICEGEKDTDAAIGVGLAAVTNICGAYNFSQEHAKVLGSAWIESEQRSVFFVIADRDTAGESRARSIRNRLIEAGVAEHAIVAQQSAVLRPSSDLSDHLDAGYGPESLVSLSLNTTIASSRPSPGDFFDGNAFVSRRMGKFLSERSAFLVGKGRRLYRYANGVFKPDGRDWVSNQMRDVLGEKFRDRHCQEAIAWLSAGMTVDLSDVSTTHINVKNGMLDWAEQRLESHSDSFRSFAQLPVAWSPAATCPRILAFLHQVLPDPETVKFMLEIIGYTLLAANPLHRAVLLVGPGRNGKSVLLAIIRSLLGRENIASIPLQEFSERRFASANLFGKLANICGDIDARAVRRTDKFKMMTGGDPLHAERKYGQPFEFISYATPIFSANEAPRSDDQSDAWFDRWAVVPMPKRIPQEEQDPSLVQKLTEKCELEGLLVESVSSLGRLMARGRFDTPSSVAEANREYRESVDSVASFFDEVCEFGVSHRVERRVFLAAYSQHCKDFGFQQVQPRALYKRLRNEHPAITELKLNNGHRFFGGVSIRR